MQKIIENKYPNLVSENAVICDEYLDAANVMSNYLIDEFLQLCKIPHASGHIEKMREYLIDWGNKHNVSTFCDCGNVFMDLPETDNAQHLEKVIFQSHFDMVAVASKDYPDFNPATTQVKPIYDKEHNVIHTGWKTSLGADDGYGVAASLAMILLHNNPNIKFEHGPIRFIFTYDEETSQEGAVNLAPYHLDANYLINMDSTFVGEITTSSCGGFCGTFLSETSRVSPEDIDLLVKLELYGLQGGHSGEDINKNRTSAVQVLLDFLKCLKENKIDICVVSLKSGDLVNAIPDKFCFEFCINSKDFEKCYDIWNHVFSTAVKRYSDGDSLKFNLDKQKNYNGFVWSKTETSMIIKLLSTMPIGVIDSFEGGTPMTSNNLGFLEIKDDLLKAEFLFRANEYNKIKELIKSQNEICYENDFDLTIKSILPTWHKKENNPLVNLFVDAFEKVANIKAKTRDIHAGLEVGQFSITKPELNIISVGCDVIFEHNVKETLFTKSIPVFCATIMYVLKHISK